MIYCKKYYNFYIYKISPETFGLWDTWGIGPASRDPQLRYLTSYHYCDIYINHMVSKVITKYGQTCFSRPTRWFKVNHGLYLCYSTLLPALKLSQALYKTCFTKELRMGWSCCTLWHFMLTCISQSKNTSLLPLYKSQISQSQKI